MQVTASSYKGITRSMFLGSQIDINGGSYFILTYIVYLSHFVQSQFKISCIGFSYIMLFSFQDVLIFFRFLVNKT